MSLLTPDFGLLFWMLLSFLIVLFILGKYGWPVIIGMIKKRGDYIEDSIKAANEAYEKLNDANSKSEQIRAEAINEQLNIIREADTAKAQIISEAKKQAEIEAEKIIANAKATIQQEKENAIKDIRAQVTELSVNIAEKVLRKELENEKSQIDMINRLLDEINTVKS